MSPQNTFLTAQAEYNAEFFKTYCILKMRKCLKLGI
jgi:hypothetical protein